MSAPVNPYAAPTADVDDVNESADGKVEALRQEHIKHEASIQSAGLLYVLGGLFGASAAVFGFLAVPKTDGASLLFPLFMVGFSGLWLYVGVSLRKLKPWTRIPAALLAVLGLFNIGLGTLISAYILWLVLSKKGRFILSPEYAAIVAATPHIKYRTSIIVWILLGLIVLGLAAAFLIPMFAR